MPEYRRLKKRLIAGYPIGSLFGFDAKNLIFDWVRRYVKFLAERNDPRMEWTLGATSEFATYFDFCWLLLLHGRMSLNLTASRPNPKTSPTNIEPYTSCSLDS